MIKTIIFSIIESLIRNISGGLGQRIRYFYYKNRFKHCGSNVKIDEGVIFQNPENINIGNNVWFLPYSIITARPIGKKINNRLNIIIGLLFLLPGLLQQFQIYSSDKPFS